MLITLLLNGEALPEVQPDFWTSLSNFWTSLYSDFGLTLLMFGLFLVYGVVLIKLITTGVRKATVKSKRLDNSASTFITSVVSVVLYIVLVIVLLSTLGISTAGVIAAFSAIALAISLGLQNTLSSVTNGIIIIFTKPFKQGDFIDVGGTLGTVKNINLFHTTLHTPDNLNVIVPNNAVLSANLVNYSKNPLRRLSIDVPVPYATEVEDVKAILNGCIAKNKKIVDNPAPFCRLTQYADSSLIYTVRVWVNGADYWGVRFDLLEDIFNSLRAHGIEIPFNQLDVNVITTPEMKMSVKSTNKEDK